MTACVKQYALTSKDTAHFVLYSVEQQAVQHTVVLCCFCGNLTVALMSWLGSFLFNFSQRW